MKNYFSQGLKALVNPTSKDQEQRNKEYILNILLATGLLLVLAFALTVIFVSMLVFQYYFLAQSLIGFAVTVVFLSGLFVLSKRGHFKFAAILLVACFLFMSLVLIIQYGIYLPQGILLFAFTIVTSGVILSSTAAYITATFSSLIVFVTFVLHASGIVERDTEWYDTSPGIVDVLGYTFTFFAITIVSWLMYRQMQRSLRRAEASEHALKEHNELLEVRVRERTKELHKAQMERLNQLYKFAELGYTTTALFHDLANRITVLSMDVESLNDTRNNKAEILKQTNESIRYIEDLIRQVRLQVMEREAPQDFVIMEETNDMIRTLSYKNKRQKVKISVHSNIPQDTRYYGDRVVFRQIIGCLVGNAIDSYDLPAAEGKEKIVDVTLERTSQNYVIYVRDQGPGIDPKDLHVIFEPFYTTKKQGMGIGLFISRQLAQQQFDGMLTVESQPGKGTTFILRLPRKKKDEKSS